MVAQLGAELADPVVLAGRLPGTTTASTAVPVQAGAADLGGEIAPGGR